MNKDEHLIEKFYTLTLKQRHRQVISWATAGLSNDEIARELCIAPQTVADHFTAVYALMGNLEPYQNLHPNRMTLMMVFIPFFQQYPHLLARDTECK
jgi:FixJ family two-component response regulator